ncbi:MAG: hypothetical protein ACTSR8_12350 [Promethearchaeota archaeon]
MSIEAKVEGILRLVGSALILISLFPTVFIDILVLNCPIVIYILISTISPWMLLFILAKLEKDIIIEYFLFYVIFLLAFTIGLIIIGLNACIDPNYVINFILVSISYILLLFCWYYSLSIYKKEKFIFLIAGLAYLIIRIPFIIWELIEIIIFSVGFCLILIAERSMKKKGMLKYI